MYSLGINIGASSVKVILLEGNNIVWNKVEPHEGDFLHTLKNILLSHDLPPNIKALATGTEGRHLLNINSVIEPLCMEEALRNLNDKVDALVSLGGEDLVVYTIDENQKIITSFSGNKCASGTGEFFKQQLARMNMNLDAINAIPEQSRALKLSSRCSVFMKSDCTHRLNKGEATRGDIVLSLSDVMATKVIDFIKKAKIINKNVLLVGGVTQNQHLLRFLQERMPENKFILPGQATYFEAYGAALLAQNSGSLLPSLEDLFKPNRIEFKRFKSLKTAQGKVTYLPSKKAKVTAGKEYILGVDGGSTTTKACLIDIETNEITASFYGRTHGDPVKALKNCFVEMQKQIKEDTGAGGIRITLAATTGSSRELLGVFLETPAVYNEIIAHAVGTTFYKENIDTIFEIGGQDAKYVFLKNKVPIDYAMNEACSAGTGSFLEESAQGDLNIPDAAQIGDIALEANEPLKFGEHCSAFINSDVRKAIQQGASREDITAGIVTSIVSNYLNRVVGNRTLGKNIVLQGGVAKNKAIPLAFAMLLDKEILVPPDPELMGCFGVGILARQKLEEGFLTKGHYSIEEILTTEIVYEKEFQCKACDNFCPIRILNVNGNKYMFGGRCNKYANIRKKKVFNENEVFDYIERRNDILFKECAPNPEDFIRKKDCVVGIPRCFSVYTLWPLYSWFFHNLGVETFVSGEISHEGTARVESNYCFPAEIAHGAVQDILNRKTDFIFLPHFRDMESYEKNAPANFCPITQSLPYYIKKAFPEIPDEKYLAPVVSFMYGTDKAAEPFIEIAVKLGFSELQAKESFSLAYEKQMECFARFSELGKQALAEARQAKRPVIAILGRPYNSFTTDANMDIPKKYTSRGYSVIPFDILPFEDQAIYPNMYWYYGQQDMKAAKLLKNEDNIFVTYISNFSCAPDSFLLHYLKWTMGIKPFLILELDSHTADAGVDTRIEAFLDIIEGYRSKLAGIHEERYDNGLRFINNPGEEIHIKNDVTGAKIPIKNNSRVKLLLSNMGKLSSELVGATIRGFGINAETMPVPDIYTLQMARNHASGKECLPSHLVLGSALKYLSSGKYRKDEIYILFVPTTTGPCRTGQYFVFFENLFRDLRMENVVIFTLDSDNSYNELGTDFSKYIWWAFIIGDYMKDIETSLKTCAVDPAKAMMDYDKIWQIMINAAEQNVTKILPVLREVSRDITKIPLKNNIDKYPKILIVGEIYVRRDDFAVDELIRNFSRRGIIGKVSGVSEWVYYCDFVRLNELKKKLSLLPWYRRPSAKEFMDLIKWNIEHAYKHNVEKNIRQILASTGLIPDSPHDMKEIMKNTEEHFVSQELYSEISISSGVAATAMTNGYSGIVNISPFACLIGRVIEGVLTPWARERKYPIISVEIDGNLLPPNVINKLEIFMLNVHRFRDNESVNAISEK
ncbi:MAG: activase [Deltaproteobacteria bacterium HGW-Deltaproteobacteria-13]|jgi:predicted CoA-substrate-specific enzyme activase|nr:MAG: activase [Deltaproteobacteria bacterium HGW-Deltaproteobacteria-13]